MIQNERTDPAFISKNKAFPRSPGGRKTDNPKNPFQSTIKISKDHHPQTGQIAMINEITLIKPTAAPIGTSLGLYSSISDVPAILGMMKVEKTMRQTIMVYPVILSWKNNSLIFGFLNK